MSSTENKSVLPPLNETVEQLVKGFDQISAEHKELLNELTQFVQSKINAGQKVYLNFICTYNSRRSHLSQIWAQAAAYYYGIPGTTKTSLRL